MAQWLYRCIRISFPFLIFVALTGSPVCPQAKPGPSSSPKSTSPKAPPAPANSAAGGPSIQSKVASDAAAVGDIGDYVRCEFTRAELLHLRPQPDVLTYTPADEEFFRAQIIDEALSSDNAGAFTPGQRDAFVKHIAETSFQGLTPTQAIGKALNQLSLDTAPPGTVSDLLKCAARTNQEFALCLQTEYGTDPKTASSLLGAQELSPEEKLAVAEKIGNEQQAKVPPSSRELANAAKGSNLDFGKYVSSLQKIEISPDLGQEEQSQRSKLDVLSQKASATNQSSAAEAASDAKTFVNGQDLAATASEGQAVLKSTPQKNQIAQAVQKTTALNKPPDDVGCSMSVLSHTAARYAFGQKIADEFIPVQIVVRNLNPNLEFLVHDAEVAVDTDINGSRGRYSSGVDKLTVRTFMLAAKDYDHRNFTVHLIQGAGTVLSAASLVYGPGVKDASNVFNQGFIPALTGVWTDHSTDQLNLLNDEGFSSYRTERTVVPKSGTAEFVIFIRSDLFREGWWTQDCANNIVVKKTRVSGVLDPKQQAKCLGQFNVESPDPKCYGIPEIGVDLEAARRVCIHYYLSPENRPPAGKSSDTKLFQIEQDDEMTGDLAYFKPNSINYKNWSASSRALFRELSFAVVAGTHILEQADTTAALTKIDCPTDDKGDIDFDKADGNNLVCTLTGNNLDKVQTLKLRNSADATDMTTASAAVTTTSSGNSKITKATFTLDSLGKLPAKLYKVSIVTAGGVETPSDQLIHLSGDPYLPPSGKPDPNSVNFETLLGNNAKAVPVKLTGFHLDELQSVQLSKADKSPGSVTTFKVPVETGATATQAQLTLTTEGAKGGKISGDFTNQNLELAISLISKSSPNSPIPTKQVLFGTGKVSATTPVAPGGSKPTVTVSPKTLSFGAQATGTTSSSKAVTLTNQEVSALTQITAKVSGANASDFIPETDPCKGKVEAKAKCDIAVQFKPSTNNKVLASLDITYSLNGAQQKLTVALTGGGSKPGSAPAATISPKTLTFGMQKKGTASAEKPVTIVNSGSTALTGFTIDITGNGSKSFNEKNTCGTAVAASGGKCDVAVQFEPTSTGKLSASLVITYTVDGQKKTQSVALGGTATE